MAASTPALATLAGLGIDHVVHRIADADDLGRLDGLGAASALGVEPGRVLKTLVVSGAAGPALMVVSADRRLDLRAAAWCLGTKRVELTEPNEAARLSRSVVGAISPIGFPGSVPTVIDGAAEPHPTVYVSAGRRGLEVELAPADLARATAGEFGPVSRTSLSSR